MYVRPILEQETLSFGVSGALWREALVMVDRQTGSLWSQREHRAIQGELAGRSLQVLPSEITAWRAWRAHHPETRVLVKAGEVRSLGPAAVGLVAVLAGFGLAVLYRAPLADRCQSRRRRLSR